MSILEMTAAQKAEVKKLDALYSKLLEVRNSLSPKNVRAAPHVPFPLFVRQMRLLNPQSWGTRVQNWLIDHYGWTPVPPSDERGDALDEDGEHWEVKVTMPTMWSSRLNFVQIRPFHDIAGYHMFVITPDNEIVRYRLTKAQMHTELELCGQFAHGVSTATTDNQEFAIRFYFGKKSPTAQRWKKYIVDSEIQTKM
jgi:hypothetical protein